MAHSQNQQIKRAGFLEAGILPVVTNNSRHENSQKDSCLDPFNTWSNGATYFNKFQGQCCVTGQYNNKNS